MMKRTMTNGGAVLIDPAAPKEHYVTVSKAPNTDTTKVVWHVDPAALGVPRDEELKRKSPEAKFLYLLSAVLTIIVLWGIVRQIHYVVPRIYHSGAAVLGESFNLGGQTDQVDSFAADVDSVVGAQRGGTKRLLEFDFDVSGSIGGRRSAKHLLAIPTVERDLVNRQVYRRPVDFRNVWNPHREQTNPIRS